MRHNRHKVRKVIRVFYLQTDAQVNCFKTNFKIYIKISMKKAATCFGAVTPSSGSALLVLQTQIMRSLMMVWLHRNMLRLFYVNFNVKFKLVFKTIRLSISWWKKTLIVSRCTVCMWKFS